MEDKSASATGSKARARPDAARELASEILERVEDGRAYASILLEQLEPRLPDPRDAALLHELVLGVLRRKAALDHALALVCRRPLARVDREILTALRLGAYELLYLDRVPDFAAVSCAVERVKRRGHRAGVPFANAVLRQVARQGAALLPPAPREGDVAALALFHSHPAWWVERVVARLKWRAACELLACNNRPARTVLRPNLRRIESAALATRLESDGIATEKCRFVPEALRIRSGRLTGTRSLDEGLAWVQDEASQLVPKLLGRPLGPRVGDLCAAPGGKSMQLCEALPAGAFLVAADQHRGRLRRLVDQAGKLGATPLGAVQADLRRATPFRVRFDQILLDAPCSGTGTLRRHPEIRWRLSLADIQRLAALQARLIARAASLLAPGGRLVYAVCSLEPEEGEKVVGGFLEQYPEFERGDAGTSIPAELASSDGFLHTSPVNDGLDGFFAALVVRRGASR